MYNTDVIVSLQATFTVFKKKKKRKIDDTQFGNFIYNC